MALAPVLRGFVVGAAQCWIGAMPSDRAIALARAGVHHPQPPALRRQALVDVDLSYKGHEGLGVVLRNPAGHGHVQHRGNGIGKATHQLNHIHPTLNIHRLSSCIGLAKISGID